MGTKYTSQSSSGYNAGNPPDDGTTGDDNKIKWSGIKTSLTDVLKVFSDNINTELLAWFDFDTNVRSSAYTTIESDNGKTIECTASAPITLGAAATMGSGYEVTVKTVSGTTTVAVGGADEIDGSATTRNIVAGASETYVVNSAEDAYLIKSDVKSQVSLESAFLYRNNNTGITDNVLTQIAFGNTGSVFDTGAFTDNDPDLTVDDSAP